MDARSRSISEVTARAYELLRVPADSVPSPRFRPRGPSAVRNPQLRFASFQSLGTTSPTHCPLALSTTARSRRSACWLRVPYQSLNLTSAASSHSGM